MELHSNPEWWRIAIASIGDAVITTDTKGFITFMNPMAQSLTGWSLEDSVGVALDKVFNITNEDTHFPVANPATRALQEGVVVGLANHTVLVAKDGTEKPIDDSAAPIRDEQGNISGVVLVFRDVTVRRQQEVTRQNQLEETKRQAELAIKQTEELLDIHRRKDEFLAMLSHELRNPLAPVVNAVQLLNLQKHNENAIQQKARVIIERQVGTMKVIIDDMLEVSRITTGRIQLHKENVNLQNIIGKAIESVQSLIDQRKQKLTVSQFPEPIWLNADSIRIEQVLVNLLTNAAKYTNEGGHIYLGLERINNEAVIHVRDTGIGIDPSLLPRIFDLFVQAEQSLSRSNGGLGIGLTIVQKLVDMHEGKIEVSSVVGQGSNFVVRLPIAPHIGNGRNKKSLRVLIVDDNIDMVETMVLMLRMLGEYEIKTAYDGKRAFEEFVSFQPSVVMLDIGLPVFNGYEVAKMIRKEQKEKNTLIIALTGYGQEEDKKKSHESGFDYHLVKPVDVDRIMAILNKATPS